MKIEFKKIPYDGIEFNILSEDVNFFGKSIKIRKNLVKCTGGLKGSFLHEYAIDVVLEFVNNLDEDVKVYASDGIYDEEFLDVVEFFDGSIDFDTLLTNEIESIKSDYLYCDRCKRSEI